MMLPRRKVDYRNLDWPKQPIQSNLSIWFKLGSWYDVWGSLRFAGMTPDEIYPIRRKWVAGMKDKFIVEKKAVMPGWFVQQQRVAQFPKRWKITGEMGPVFGIAMLEKE
jgi:hypothetical protein